jgi:hypothetical protein
MFNVVFEQAWMAQLTNDMHIDTIPAMLGGNGSDDVVLTCGWVPSAHKKDKKAKK